MEIVVYILIAVGILVLGCYIGIFMRRFENRRTIDRVLDTHVKEYHLKEKLRAVLKVAIH